MADAKAIQYIQRQIRENGFESSLKDLNILNADGVATKEHITDYFIGLADLSVKNGVFSDKDNDKVKLTKASAFSLYVLTTSYISEKYKHAVTEFFNDKKNDAWFEEQKIGKDEKDKLLKELYENSEQAGMTSSVSPEGKQLIDNMRKAFKEAKPEQLNSLYEQALNLVYYGSHNMEKTGKAQESLDSAHDTIKKTSGHLDVAEIMYESLSKNVNELAREVDFNPWKVQQSAVFFGRGAKVQPSEFVERAEKNKLTYEDRVWATEQVKNLTANISDSQKEAGNKNIVINLGDFQLNGKPMFSSVELSNKFLEEISCNIILNVFKGEDVAVKSPEMKDPVHVEPKFVEKENKNRSIWQQIYDFIVNLLTTPEKDKVAAMGKDIAAKSEQNKMKRERISFAELAGLNAFNKVTAPPAKQKEMELAEIKKAPEMKSR